VVLFTQEVDTGCGLADSGVGPFYCPADRQAYIDLSFYRVLRDKLDAGGDFAQAYVLAHEIGHHVQNQLGTMRGKRDNETSVRVELQADCLAGVWAHSTNQRRLLEDGDIEESMNARRRRRSHQEAAAGYVVPDASLRTSAQRVRWFTKGFKTGT
jgi:predicted metalloprotease